MCGRVHVNFTLKVHNWKTCLLDENSFRVLNLTIRTWMKKMEVEIMGVLATWLINFKTRKTFHLSISLLKIFFYFLSPNLPGVLTWNVIVFYEPKLKEAAKISSYLNCQAIKEKWLLKPFFLILLQFEDKIGRRKKIVKIRFRLLYG